MDEKGEGCLALNEARALLDEAKYYLRHDRIMSAEQALVDAISAAHSTDERDIGVAFIANAKLAKIYVSKKLHAQARCCSSEALYLFHATFRDADIQSNKTLRAVYNDMISVYIGATRVDLHACGEDSTVTRFSAVQLRQIRVDNKIFPMCKDVNIYNNVPPNLKEYSAALTYRYRHDLLFDSSETHPAKNRKQRGGKRRNKTSTSGDVLTKTAATRGGAPADNYLRRGFDYKSSSSIDEEEDEKLEVTEVTTSI